MFKWVTSKRFCHRDRTGSVTVHERRYTVRHRTRRRHDHYTRIINMGDDRLRYQRIRAVASLSHESLV